MKRILFTLLISLLAVFQTSCDALEEALADFSGCTLEDAPNYDSSKTIPCTTDCLGEQTGSNCCCEEIIYGCMDESAPNYSDTANAPCVEVVSGIETLNACCVASISGCMDEGANNYNSLATVSDESQCTYDEAEVTLEDGSTATVVYGCMNDDACNHVESATADCNQENAAIAGSEWTQNDDCCDLNQITSCYLDLNNNGYYEVADTTANTCNCAEWAAENELGVGWVTGDDVADDMEVQGCTEPTMNGQVCIEYNPAANVDNGGCCMTELTEEDLANPEFNLVGTYNLEFIMGMLNNNGECVADTMMGDEFGPDIDQVTLGAGGGFQHFVAYYDSFDSRPEWEYYAPGVDSDVACEELADSLDTDYWFCNNWGAGDDFATCDDFYDKDGCMSGPGCWWESNFCHPTFSGMPCNDINHAPEFEGNRQFECEERDDCEWDDQANNGSGQCFTPVWEPWMECMFLDENECESNWNDDGIDHCEEAAFDPSGMDCLNDCDSCNLEFAGDEPTEDEMCSFASCMSGNTCWNDCDYDLQDEFEMFGWLSYMCDAPDSCGDMMGDGPGVDNCGENEYACGDGQCIAQEKDCDGHVDCTDGSDEQGCGPPECMQGCEGMDAMEDSSFDEFCVWLGSTSCGSDCTGEEADKLECLTYMCEGCSQPQFDCSEMDSSGEKEKQNQEQLFHFIRKIIEIPNHDSQLARGNNSGDCEDGEIKDCDGNCAPAEWVGDDYCDDGSYEYNGFDIVLNCSDFDYDGGDCDDQNDEWDEDNISCMPNTDTYPCFGYNESQCMSDDCMWHGGEMGEPGFCSPPIGNNIGTCQGITAPADCNQNEDCHWMEAGPNGEPEGCGPAMPDNCFDLDVYSCDDSPNCEWNMPDWIDPWAEGACFKHDHCKSDPNLNNNEDACNADPGCEWIWDGSESGCWEVMMNGEGGSFCECMLPYSKLSCEAGGGSWELPPWAMEGDEWVEHECMMPMSEQDCFHEFIDEDPCAEDFSGGNEQTNWDAASHTCTKSFGFSEAGIWSINTVGDFCIEWDNDEGEVIDCNTLMMPDECSCFDECMWNGATGTCEDDMGRVSNQLYAQRYENMVEELSNNNNGDCFEYEMVGSELHILFIDDVEGYCEEMVFKPATSGT